MRKLLIISLILFGLSPLVKGQMLTLNYQMSVPLGKMMITPAKRVSGVMVLNTIFP